MRNFLYNFGSSGEWLAVALMLVVGPTTIATANVQEHLPELPKEARPSLFHGSWNEEALEQAGPEAKKARFTWIEASENDESFGQRLVVESLEPTDQPWGIGLHSKTNPDALMEGTWVVASFFARASPGSSEATFRAYLQRPEPTWIGIAEVGSRVAESWRQFVLAGRVPSDFGAGSVNLSIHLGFAPQSIEIAGATVFSLPKDIREEAIPVSPLYYDGMEPEAPWRDRAREMIDRHRKGDLRILVRDRSGKPLEGAQVAIELVKHDYQFGTFFDRLILQDTVEARKYGDWLKDNFNYATNPVYWADWGWADAERRRDYIGMAAWLQERGLPSRGHVLIYPGRQFAPAELMALADDREAFQARILRHLEEIVPVMKSYEISEYDVTNELRQLTEFVEIVGWKGVVEWFHKVRELDPLAVLYINENSILTEGGANRAAQDHYYDLISRLLEMGAPIGGIGMQGHFAGGGTSPEGIWEILDRFSAFNLPIRITEYDFSTRDKEGQARFETDFYTAIFSHPSTVGLTRWGFYEPVMWRPQGAMIDASGEYKPNGLALRKLLNETWTTRSAGYANADGVFSARGFYGTYRVRVRVENAFIPFDVEFSPPEKEATSSPIEIRWPR